MGWLFAAVVVIAVAGIWLLSRYYRKASREVALVRTGFGGQRVVLDGGVIALPFLHNVADVNMKTLSLEIARDGSKSLITQDRLRVDITAEFYLRVGPDQDGVAAAAQTLGGKTFRGPELQEVLGGKLLDALQAVVARTTLDALHEKRSEFVREVAGELGDKLSHNGLRLESVSLTRLDQTPFEALEENNAFNAVGMRRLAEVIAANKKQRAAIEADADAAVRQSQLDAAKRRLQIDREQREAEIEQQITLENLQADQRAQSAEFAAAALQRSDSAELDQQRRRREFKLNSELQLELAEKQNHIDLARKAADVSAAEADADQARAAAVTAAAAVSSAEARAVAERAREVALIRAREQSEVSASRSAAAADSVRSQAEAEAAAAALRANAKQTDLEAEAAGRRALVEADNQLNEAALQLHLERHKLDVLPRLAEQMVKPVEKIEGIRIHQISGLGGSGVTPTGVGGDKPLVNQAIDGLMGMAVQLPALQRLGRELGVNLEQGLTQLGEVPPAADQTDPADHNDQTEKPSKPSQD